MFPKKIFRFWDILFILGLGIFTRFWQIGLPSRVVFDEAHFALYSGKYFSGNYYFDIHPPLGKLMYALAGFLGGFNPGNFSFAEGLSYNDVNYLPLRCLSALLGIILILAVYYLVKSLGLPRRLAFLAAFFVIFDNAFLVESRLILLNVMFIAFTFLALLCFVRLQKQSPFSRIWYFYLVSVGILGGMAFSTKLIGFFALGLIWFLTLFSESAPSDRKARRKEIILKVLAWVILPLSLYFAVYVVHFALLPNECFSECGSALEIWKEEGGSWHMVEQLPKGNILLKFIKLSLFQAVGNLGSSDVQVYFKYQSPWYSWPLMVRSIGYYYEPGVNPSIASRIYLLGNPAVWFLALAGIIGYLWLAVKNFYHAYFPKLPGYFLSPIIFGGYLIAYVPFAGVQRFTLLYHYFLALIFAIIIFGLFLDRILKLHFKEGDERDDFISYGNQRANLIFLSVLVLVVMLFIFFAPLSYGTPLTDSELRFRMWLPTWN